MAVFDKELIINGKAVRSPEQQVYQNMKDIESLKEKIKDAYKTTEALTSSSTSVAIANTNAPDGTTEGWLMTSDGLLFSITGGDETNLLLSYYANLKGPQGEDGAAVNIDDAGTSLTKVWSSSKTANEIAGLINDSITSNVNTWSSDQQTKLLSSGIAWTTTDKDGDDQISLDDIYIGARTASESTSIIKVPMLKVSDLIVFVDGNLNAKTLYRVSSITGSVATVVKVCDFAQGKQMYQHNIIFRFSKSSYHGVASMTITCSDVSSSFSREALIAYIKSKGYTTSAKLFTDIHGIIYIGGNYSITSCYVDNSDNLVIGGTPDGNNIASQSFAYSDIDNSYYMDTVEPK